MKHLKVGDVVALKLNGTSMTIKYVQDKKCTCNWFKSGELHENVFHQNELLFIR